MGADSFFDALRGEHEAIHAATLAHPFVQGIGRGDLSAGAFRYYLEQDYQFLRAYVRVIARAVAAANDLATAARLASFLHATLAVEIDALQRLSTAFGGDPSQLDAVEPAAACHAYTSHLLAASAEGSLLVTLAAMLPCQWGYGEIGRALALLPPPADDRFAGWIAEYAAPEYHAHVVWLVDCLDILARAASSGEREQARRAFAHSTRHELAFWEMALTASRAGAGRRRGAPS